MEYQGARPGRRKRGGKSGGNSGPQLFDDTSSPPPGPPQQMYQPDQNAVIMDAEDIYNPGVPPQQTSGGYYGGPPAPGPDQSGAPGGWNQQFGGQQFLNDPMANMAMQYGTNLADQGKDLVNKKLESYMSSSKLKYYFAVDTSYVGKKLGLLMFPFAHKDWSIKYNQDEPVAPRYEVNAPDLYIPVMAFVTYILLAGVVLGTQDRFTPEQLGVISSSAMVWLVIEILVILFSMYVLQVSTDLKYLDLLAYCGYKYVGMLFILIGGSLFESTGYYVLLLWYSITISFFLVRTLKMAIIPHADQDGSGSLSHGNKRRLYTLVVIALSQPFFMWWLTRSVVAP